MLCVVLFVCLVSVLFSMPLLSVPGDALKTHQLLCFCGQLNLIDQVVKPLMSVEEKRRKEKSRVAFVLFGLCVYN